MRFILPLLFIFVTACSGQKPLTVAEVVQNAERLNGKTVRVRALAYLWVNPSRTEMWMFGGCAPGSTDGHVVGWLTLYDAIDRDDIAHYGVPHDETGIKISESNFHCEGNYCQMICSSFDATSEQMYQFVGMLRVNGQSDFTLENIDLDRSSRLVDGEWVPIREGDFNVFFP